MIKISVCQKATSAWVSLAIIVCASISSNIATAASSSRLISCEWLGAPPGSGPSMATGVSADGATVVGFAIDATNKYRAFRWTRAEGMRLLDPAGPETVALATNDDGSVIVGWRTNNDRHGAFRWDRQSGIEPLSFLPGSDMRVEANATGISGDGVSAVGSHVQAVLWQKQAAPVALPALSNRSPISVGQGINKSGTVIVGASVDRNGNQEPVRWRLDPTDKWTAEGLGFPEGSTQAVARVVSATGEIIAGEGYDEGGQKAFRWTENKGIDWLRPLVPGARESGALGISADGRTIVGYSDGNPVVWIDDEPPFSLKPFITGADPQGSDSYAEGISADGSVIVGGADPQTGPTEAVRCQMRSLNR